MNLTKLTSLNTGKKYRYTEESIAQKNELRLLGAIKNNEITDIGREMLLLPSIPIQLSRMLVEANIEGCLEEVMIICSIIHSGSLIDTKKGTYSTIVTNEKDSDLLAELEVWYYIRQNKPDFYKDGLSKRNFFSALNFYKQLSQIIPYKKSSSKDRKKILKCCMAGLATNSYYYNNEGFFEDSKYNAYLLNGTRYRSKGFYRMQDFEYTNDARIDRKSNVCDTYDKIVIGIPKVIYSKDGEPRMNVLTLNTSIRIEEIAELLPTLVKEEVTQQYNPEKDALEITKVKTAFNKTLESTSFSLSHGLTYEELKAEWEENEKRETTVETDKKVVINSKTFEVVFPYYSSPFYYQPPYIEVDIDTIMEANTDELWLPDHSKRIWFYVEELNIKAVNINYLKELYLKMK